MYHDKTVLASFKIPPQCRWQLRSSGLLRTDSGNVLQTIRENQSRNVGTKLPLGFLISEDRNDKFSEMSIRNYQYFLRNNPEECSSKIRRVRFLLFRDFEFDNLMPFCTKVIRKLIVTLF